MNLISDGVEQFLDNLGAPVANGKIYFYAQGTSVLADTYPMKGGGSPNPNPVILDANGRAAIWGNVQYYIQVESADGSSAWEMYCDASGTGSENAQAGGPSQVGFIQAGIGSRLRTLQNKLRESLSLQDQADVDATACCASDTQFINLNTYIASLAAENPAMPTGNRMGAQSIKLPPGAYLLTESAAFLNGALWATRTTGLAIHGDGPPGSVIILYKPTMSGPFINNPDHLLNIQFKNIGFVGYDTGSDFFSSYSTGGAQSYTFEDCYFSGRWRYGVSLSGNNNNSEMKWLRCNFSGTWLSYLFSPTTANGGSDQFLNYWFTNCQVSGPSPFIDMSTGGHIRMTDCDVSGYQGQTTQTYLINLRGNSHARGVCSFVWKGGRAEQKTPLAGIIYSEWPGGTIDFDCVDFSSQAGNPGSNTMVSASFVFSGGGGPHVTWRNCSIMGRHQYSYTIQSFQSRSSISYQSCQIANFLKITDFLSLPVGSNTGGAIPIDFDNCSVGGATGAVSDVYNVAVSSQAGAFSTDENLNFSNGATAAFIGETIGLTTLTVRSLTGTIPTSGTVVGATSGASSTILGSSVQSLALELGDVTLNWQNSANGLTKTRIVSLKDYNSRCPFGGSIILKCLPLASVITRARIFTTGQTYGGAWNLIIATASGKTLAHTQGTQLSATGGFNTDNPLFIPCATDSDRTIVYQDLQNWSQPLSNVYALIDYI